MFGRIFMLAASKIFEGPQGSLYVFVTKLQVSI